MIEKPQNLAVLWDMDGVLVDTGDYHFLAWKEMFEVLGIPFAGEDFRQTFGMNNTGILEWAYGRKPTLDEVAEVNVKKETLFRELVKGKAKLLPGVLQWLGQLRTWDYKQAIASSAPIENIDVLVADLNIGEYFGAIVSGADLPGKPNPDIFLKAAELLQVRPENCIVIEDAIPGVAGAKRAGMKCIAVTTTNPASKLAQADRIVGHLGKLSEEDFFSLLA